MGANGAEDGAERIDGELRGGAAAEVDGFERLMVQLRGAFSQLASEGAEVVGAETAVGLGVEVAITAALGAEGDVDVEAGHWVEEG